MSTTANGERVHLSTTGSELDSIYRLSLLMMVNFLLEVFSRVASVFLPPGNLIFPNSSWTWRENPHEMASSLNFVFFFKQKHSYTTCYLSSKSHRLNSILATFVAAKNERIVRSFQITGKGTNWKHSGRNISLGEKNRSIYTAERFPGHLGLALCIQFPFVL